MENLEMEIKEKILWEQPTILIYSYDNYELYAEIDLFNNHINYYYTDIIEGCCYDIDTIQDYIDMIKEKVNE